MFVFYWSPSYKYLLLDFHFHFFKFLAETFQNTVDSHFCFWLTTAYFPVFSAFSFMLVWRANGPRELHTGTDAKRLILCNIPWPIFNTPLAHVCVYIGIFMYTYAWYAHSDEIPSNLIFDTCFEDDGWVNILSIFDIFVNYTMVKWRFGHNVNTINNT